MPKLTNGAVRFVAVSVIDCLSPRGDLAMARALQQIVDAGVASKDQHRIRLNTSFHTVIYRLRTRAQRGRSAGERRREPRPRAAVVSGWARRAIFRRLLTGPAKLEPRQGTGVRGRENQG